MIASNVDDTEGAAGNQRQAFIGQGFIPASYELGEESVGVFPKEGKIKALVGVSAPWPEAGRSNAQLTAWGSLRSSRQRIPIARW